MKKFCRKCGRGFNAPKNAPNYCPTCLFEVYKELKSKVENKNNKQDKKT